MSLRHRCRSLLQRRGEYRSTEPALVVSIWPRPGSGPRSRARSAAIPSPCRTTPMRRAVRAARRHQSHIARSERCLGWRQRSSSLCSNWSHNMQSPLKPAVFRFRKRRSFWCIRPGSAQLLEQFPRHLPLQFLYSLSRRSSAYLHKNAYGSTGSTAQGRWKSN